MVTYQNIDKFVIVQKHGKPLFKENANQGRQVFNRAPVYNDIIPFKSKYKIILADEIGPTISSWLYSQIYVISRNKDMLFYFHVRFTFPFHIYGHIYILTISFCKIELVLSFYMLC